MIRSRFAQTGPSVGPSPLRSSILADGELTARDAERVVWDVIVVGTGMGGGTLGYRLARSGRKVLFVEKGRSTLPGTPGTIRSAMPELAEPRAYRSTAAYYDALARAGRTTDEIEDISGRFLEAASCRSSAAAPAAPRPFTAWSANDSSCAISHPGKTSATPAIPACPRPGRSPMTRCDPGTPRPRSCSGSAANPIPCGPRPPRSACPRRRRSPYDNQPLVDYLTGRGLHPYHLPMACDYTDGLCHLPDLSLSEKSCKNDAARNGVLPAVTEHGAHLLDRMSGGAPRRRPHPGPAGDLPSIAPTCWP